MKDTIIQGMIDTMQAEYEHCQLRLRVCHPDDEDYWLRRLTSAKVAQTAMASHALNIYERE